MGMPRTGAGRIQKPLLNLADTDSRRSAPACVPVGRSSTRCQWHPPRSSDGQKENVLRPCQMSPGGQSHPWLRSSQLCYLRRPDLRQSLHIQSDFPRLEERLAAALLALNFQEGQTASRWETIFKA